MVVTGRSAVARNRTETGAAVEDDMNVEDDTGEGRATGDVEGMWCTLRQRQSEFRPANIVQSR